MSAGYFDYRDSSLKNEIFRYADKPINVFEDREISELIWDVFSLIHEYDLYASGDTGRDRYIQSKTAFKKKWFGNSNERVKRIIDNSVNELRQELLETFVTD